MDQLSIKYRPKYFYEVVGNDLIKKALSSTRVRNNIPNAILFSGFSGTGKTTLARIYTKYINCLSPKLINDIYEPCNECEICDLIENHTPIDLTEINAANHRGIDEMRNLIESSQLGNYDLNYKVIIIDEAQQLTKEAQNILLKPMEEENVKYIFIICTTNPEKLLDTIINRCSRFNLRKISTELICNKLEDICKIENIEYDSEALNEISLISEGSLRDSLNMLDQCSNANNQKVNIDIISHFSNNIPFKFILHIINNLLQNKSYDIYKIISILEEKNIPAINILNKITSYLNDLILFKETGNINIINYKNNDYLNNIKNHCSNLQKQELLTIMTYFIEVYKNIDSYPKPMHLLNLAFSKALNVKKQL